MASTERPAFLHWKKAVPHSKTKPPSQRVRLKVEETREKVLKPEEKVGVLQLPPSTVDRPGNGEHCNSPYNNSVDDVFSIKII